METGVNMKYLVLIQARCGSKRLPTKVLKDLAGKSVLERVIERVRRSKKIDDLAVVTSVDKNNFPLISLCAETGTRIFVGSEDDVLDRYYQCARLFQPEYVIRITADCPVIDWRYIDLAIEQLKPETDYMTEFSETFPDGLDIEIVKFSVLRRLWKEARLASEREHVTYYIRTHKDQFQLQDFVCPIPGISDHRWTIDEEEDYTLVKNIYEHFAELNKEDFVTEDILAYFAEKPELRQINQKYERNEGMKISLQNDRLVKVIE